MTRFPSNVLAAIAIPPVILLWAQNGIRWLREDGLRRQLEALVLVLGLLGTGFLVFASPTAGLQTTPALVYLPLPFLLWATMRFGSIGVSTSLIAVVLISIWGAAHGRGPFVNNSPAENVLSLQLFFVAISLPLMFLAGSVEERRKKPEFSPRARAASVQWPTLHRF